MSILTNLEGDLKNIWPTLTTALETEAKKIMADAVGTTLTPALLLNKVQSAVTAAKTIVSEPPATQKAMAASTVEAWVKTLVGEVIPEPWSTILDLILPALIDFLFKLPPVSTTEVANLAAQAAV